MDKIIQEDLQTLKSNLKSFGDKITGKTFLVTGGAGFLGSWICDTLDVFGANIICVDNLISGSLKNIEHLMNRKNFKFVNHDITKLFQIDGPVDYIFHLASPASPAHYQKHGVETLTTNLIGTMNIVTLAREKKVKGLLFTSTSEVYGDPPENFVPTPEHFPGHVSSIGPRAVYDEGKRAAEAYLFAAYRQYNEPPIRIVRIFNTYGPRIDVGIDSQYSRALIKFVWQALNGKPITIFGDGKQTRSFCYITDQVEGLFKLLLTDGLDGEVVNIGNDREVSISDLANSIKKISSSASEIIFAEANYDLKHDPKRRCPDLTKARTILNYQPKVDLDTGLQKTFIWMRGS